MLLRFTHLGRSHHLHRFGDLRGVADRFDPAPYRLEQSHVLFHRDWVVLVLLKKLDDTLTAIESRSCGRIEVRTKLRKRSELAKLRQIELHFARNLLDRLDLRRGANAADGQTDRNCRSNALIKQISLQINLTVRD